MGFSTEKSDALWWLMISADRNANRMVLALLEAVRANPDIVLRLGTKVDPATAVIRVDGKRLPPVSPNVYLVLNKPRGVVSTMSDPEGRRTLSDLVADRPERLFHVGRLDTDTSGLIMLTNDGDFAQRMAHPSYEVDKTYVAEVDGEVTKATVKQLLEGVTLDDGPVTVSRARIISVSGRGDGAKSIVELVIHEGRNRIVRRLLDQLGHPVRRLTRTAIGPASGWPVSISGLRDSTWTSRSTYQAWFGTAIRTESPGSISRTGSRSAEKWPCSTCGSSGSL